MKEFLKLNVKRNMVIRNAKSVAINADIVSAFSNTQNLNMI